MRENETNSLRKTKTLVGMAIFTAIVVVLQLIASFVKFGFFTPSLVLIPIVIGTAIYGIKAGAWLGFVFGVVVLIACITGADQGGYLMWGVNPAVTALICVGKGVACGALAGLTYQLLHHKNQILATVAAAVVCPVVNTGLFCLGAVCHKRLVAGHMDPRLQKCLADFIVGGIWRNHYDKINAVLSFSFCLCHLPVAGIAPVRLKSQRLSLALCLFRIPGETSCDKTCRTVQTDGFPVRIPNERTRAAAHHTIG